ncbi:flagellar hook-associated protein FlgL [uncultured Oxalicibacterium sp.]|uniref:flagellar hook-associated protein FlgL n=1 Tax=uncultured Oxalicibacterium sp. TaxID=1168540 RepID=UPI0025D78C0A|nr:flagellar hook-associated protein FlgL [uncultured Oxalicibacterium sp.]
MRISTNMLYEMGGGKVSDLQAALIKTQQQISTNRRVLTPADDPIAAASIINLSQSMAMNDQFATNRSSAKSTLSEQDSILNSISTLLQSVKTAVVGAGNASMNDEQRKQYLAQLNSNYEELLGLANTRDAKGDYIFGGFNTDNVPFTKTSTGANYNGDQGQRAMQVSASRQIATSDSGTRIFESTLTGNGSFTTSAGAANAGTGVIDIGSVTNLTQLNGATYTVTFSVDATTGDRTYLINEVPAPATPHTAQPYTSDQPIEVNGMQFTIKGEPADGDTFKVEPSKSQSIFTTLKDLISAISQPGTGGVNQAKLNNALSAINNHIDRTLDTVATVRSGVGSRLNEIESLDSTGDDLNVQYTATMADLRDIDLVAAYSLFTQQQYTLQAAQQSFVKLTGLSLFNYI